MPRISYRKSYATSPGSSTRFVFFGTKYLGYVYPQGSIGIWCAVPVNPVTGQEFATQEFPTRKEAARYLKEYPPATQEQDPVED